MYEDPTHFGDGGYGSTVCHISWRGQMHVLQRRHFADRARLALRDLVDIPHAVVF